MKSTGIFFVVVLIILAISFVSARPTKTHSLFRQKRQSDQRLAELETLLALQKYGRHRFRMDRKKGVGADGEHPPGYGIIDFRMLGRKKKSTRFSPGEIGSSMSEDTLQDPPASYHQQTQRDHPYQEDSLAVSSEDEGSIYPDRLANSDRDPTSLQANPEVYIERK